MSNIADLGPLFQWALTHDVRRPVPPIVRRIAHIGQISALHALAVANAHSLDFEVQL